MNISGIPKEFKSYFNRFRDLFSKRQFFYFTVYTYSLLVMPKEKKTVAQISRAWIPPICRSSLEKLLSEVRWDFEKVLKRARTQVIRKLSHLPKSKRSIEVVLDDSTLNKFGSKIFGAGWFKKKKNQLAARGIQIVVLGVLFEDWFIPLDFRIYLNKELCKSFNMRFDTKLIQARKMIRNLKLPRGLSVRLMFDSWYLNTAVTEAAESRGWKWYSKCRHNRKVQWETKKDEQAIKEIRVDKYVKTIEWEKLYYETNRKNPALVGHQRIGILKKIGRVKLVITSLKENGDSKVAFFCTNHTQIQMVELVKKFERRWKIEVYFRESKAHLALEKWYFRDVASVVHHLCLSLVAMITCFCIRFEQRKHGESLGTLGEFIREVQKQNQRRVLTSFLVRWNLEKISPENHFKFNELCESLGM